MTHFVFDIDGVLADWLGQVQGVLGLPHYNPEQYDLHGSLTKWQWGQVVMAMARPEFWRGMMPIHSGISSLVALAGAHKVTVVSQPPDGMPAGVFADIRQEWLRVHSGFEFSVATTHGPVDRACFPGDVLIDDSPANVRAWESTGRDAVLVGHSYNRGHVARLGRSDVDLLEHLAALKRWDLI